MGSDSPERARRTALEMAEMAALTSAAIPGGASASSAEAAAATEPDGEGAAATCVVCLDAVASHIFVPCGHVCVCKRCGESVMEAPSPTCCYCGQGASLCMRTFMLG